MSCPVGKLYIFDTSVEDACIEWLAISQTGDSLLLVPCDDFFLVGPSDIKIPAKVYQHKLNLTQSDSPDGEIVFRLG